MEVSLSRVVDGVDKNGGEWNQEVDGVDRKILNLSNSMVYKIFFIYSKCTIYKNSFENFQYLTKEQNILNLWKSNSIENYCWILFWNLSLYF